MEKITLKEALKQASVVDELKNFVGLTKDDAVGLMTPERLAAVAGGKIKKIGTSFFTTEIRDEVTKPLDIAQAVAAIIPTYGGHCNFSVIHHFQGVRKVDGLIYGDKKFGFFYIINNIGMMTKV